MFNSKIMSTDTVPKPKIAVIYYSVYGHIRTLANSICEGITEAGGEPVLLQCAETLSDEILAKMHAAPKDESVPIANAADLPTYDGILFGMPTRFGMAPAQMKALMDSTGGLFFKGELVGMPAGCFFSSGSLGGGQETTALTWVTQLTHHGMIYVPMGFTEKIMFDPSVFRGGSAYGPGTIAGGDGSRQPSKEELAIAVHYGKMFTSTADALKRGRAAQNA
eukprot:TRINITY_DN53385_c0_g1_i1.p1 TRINITY_DN53385_c0_g1~~TRINITY_DN53385_c0_g1_i1.p1  ORF type:complete len:221 (-),score=4.62 TRINITY_DN53385_c0_g1_i1:114-776(-)